MEVGRVVEFFSGVGGWHYALKECLEKGNVNEMTQVTAIEINTNANQVYSSNFPNAKLLCKDIRHLKLDIFERIKGDTWVLSPPCQPYTTLGKRKGAEDNRAGALHHLCSILSELKHKPSFICLENVPGFDQSESHRTWMKTLRANKYHIAEFLLSPTQFGIPNERRRYFCVARKLPWPVEVPNGPQTKLTTLPNMKAHSSPDQDSQFYESSTYLIDNKKRCEKIYSHCQPLTEYVEMVHWGEQEILPSSFVSRCEGYKHDLVSPQCTRSSCFTSGYTSTARGAGSLLLEDESLFNEEQKGTLPILTDDLIKQGKIRFFTPREVANIMGFPATMKLQLEVPKPSKTLYKLLGNSINVHCACHVLDFLFQPPAP